MKIITVKLPIYKNGIVFCITPDQEEAKKYFKKVHINIDNWPKTAHGHTWTLSGYYPHVWLSGVKSAKQIATMCHEVTHAAWFVLEDTGIKVTADNHEVLTYLQTFIIPFLLKSKV